MRLPEFIRSTTFRWTLVVSGAFAACILLLFGFIYWQTAAYMTARVDNTITNEVNALAADARASACPRAQQDPSRAALPGADSGRMF